MKLDVSELIKKKINEVTFDISFEMDYLERDDYRIILKSPLKIEGKAVSNSDIIEVTGTILVSVEDQCSRCLEAFEHTLNVDFEENFSKATENDEYYPIIEGELIFDDMVMDNLILSMPVRLLCNDECKGLCHNCGVNLNKVDCDCEKDTINPKFAALKDLFKQN